MLCEFHEISFTKVGPVHTMRLLLESLPGTALAQTRPSALKDHA
jgi:hypothetical protein